jgi:hypothetical protein
LAVVSAFAAAISACAFDIRRPPVWTVSEAQLIPTIVPEATPDASRLTGWLLACVCVGVEPFDRLTPPDPPDVALDATVPVPPPSAAPPLGPEAAIAVPGTNVASVRAQKTPRSVGKRRAQVNMNRGIGGRAPKP